MSIVPNISSDISPDIWGSNILPYVSSYPKYKGISKEISKYYLPPKDMNYIKKEYQNFDISITLFQYHLNRAALKKQWDDFIVLVNLIVNSIKDKNDDIGDYLLVAIGIAYTFGKKDIVTYILEKYNPSYDTDFEYDDMEFLRYRFIQAQYQLEIPHQSPKAHQWLLDIYDDDEYFADGFNEYQGDLFGAINHDIISYFKKFNPPKKINKYGVEMTMDYNTYKDGLTYILTDEKLKSQLLKNNSITEITHYIIKENVITIPMLNTLYTLLKNEKNKIALRIWDSGYENPIIINMFHKYLDIKIYTHIDSNSSLYYVLEKLGLIEY